MYPRSGAVVRIVGTVLTKIKALVSLAVRQIFLPSKHCTRKPEHSDEMVAPVETDALEEAIPHEHVDALVDDYITRQRRVQYFLTLDCQSHR